MTEKSEQGGADDLTAWCLGELEAMLAEQVRLLRDDTPVKPEDRPAHIRRIKDLIVATRMLAVARGAMARAAWALERIAGERATRQARAMGRAASAGPVEQGDEHRADDHDLERRHAAIHARFAAMDSGADGRRAEAPDQSGPDARAGRVLAVAGA